MALNLASSQRDLSFRKTILIIHKCKKTKSSRNVSKCSVNFRAKDLVNPRTQRWACETLTCRRVSWKMSSIDIRISHRKKCWDWNSKSLRSQVQYLKWKLSSMTKRDQSCSPITRWQATSLWVPWMLRSWGNNWQQQVLSWRSRKLRSKRTTQRIIKIWRPFTKILTLWTGRRKKFVWK